MWHGGWGYKYNYVYGHKCGVHSHVIMSSHDIIMRPVPVPAPVTVGVALVRVRSGEGPEGTTIVSQATAVLISLSQFLRFTS